MKSNGGSGPAASRRTFLQSSNHGGTARMAYLLYSTDPPSHLGSQDLGKVHPLTLPSLGEALAAAGALMLRGSVVWQINGSNGFVMERRDIEIECGRREGLLAK